MSFKCNLTTTTEDATMTDIENELCRMEEDIEAVRAQKRERLKNLDFFILDNSIRESTVGQLRSHTLENKFQIYEQVKKCGMKDIIVASFSNMPRVDDTFCQFLRDRGEDFSRLYSFSEVTGALKDGVYDTETLPAALPKNKEYGLRNVFFEVDLADKNCKWEEKFTTDDMCRLLRKRIEWVHNEIHQDGRTLLNLRDLPLAMTVAPQRVLTIVKYLAQLPDNLKMFALCFEDPMGEYLPEELEAWTSSLRRTMDSNGWASGKILVHIHEKWGLQMASQLDCLGGGADGVWASLCEEGAAMGHACSSVTLMNLVRLGNEKVLKKYNCTEVRNAAREITRITTGKDPHPKQVVYGERAVDLVFGFLGIGDFDLAKFFGVETPNRITTLATEDMIVDRLTKLFGPNPQFTPEIAKAMKKTMIDDLTANRKEEYMSKVGISILFDRSGGKLTDTMSDAIANVKLKDAHQEHLIAEIRKTWDEWDVRDEVKGDNCLQFDSFYGAFMAPYIGCYACPDAKNAMKAIDMDSDGLVDWNEFMVYVKWALHEYPDDCKTVDDVLSIAFIKGIIPAMRDEKMRNKTEYPGFRHGKFTNLQWVSSSNGQVPKYAVNGGWDAENAEPLYIGRVDHNGSQIVGKIHPSHHCIYVPYGGKEHKYESYEVLINPGNQVKLEWVHRSKGNVPDRAVQGGLDASGEVYYIGRHSHKNDTLPGKVHPSHKCLYISWGGKEIAKREYGVLIAK